MSYKNKKRKNKNKKNMKELKKKKRGVFCGNRKQKGIGFNRGDSPYGKAATFECVRPFVRRSTYAVDR